MDKQAVEARVEQIFIDAEPNLKSRYKTIFQTRRRDMLDCPAIVDWPGIEQSPPAGRAPRHRICRLGAGPGAAILCHRYNQADTLIVAQPGDFFFCGCTRTRSNVSLLPQGFCNDPVAKQETTDTI